MTGFTGVNWLPRKAKKLALDLTTGSGPSGVVDSALAWEEISAVFADAQENSLRVNDQLTEGYKGRNAEDALSKIGPFTDWIGQMAGLTQQVSDTADTYAESYGTAVIDMPHINDLAVLEHAKATALSAGGPLLGLSATTEGMEQDLDLRAAKAMETYESASEPAAKPVEFPAAPEVIHFPEEPKSEAGGGTSVGAAGVGAADLGPRPLSPDSIPGTVQTARAAATSFTPTATTTSGGMGFGGMGAPMAGMLAGGALAGAAGKGIKVGNGGKSEDDEDDEKLASIGATGVFLGEEGGPTGAITGISSATDRAADFEYVDATTQLERGGSKGSVAPAVLGANAEL